MSEITFERGGETMVLKMEHHTGVAKFDATPADIAAFLDAHPEIAEAAGWIRKAALYPATIRAAWDLVEQIAIHEHVVPKRVRDLAEKLAMAMNGPRDGGEPK